MPDKPDKPSVKWDTPGGIIGGDIKKIQSPLPADHPYYSQIGRVASEWTHFERLLDEIIRDISNIPNDIALCITGQIMGAAPRYKAIEALGKHVGLSEATLKEVRRLKNDTFAIAEQRHRIVHDPWFRILEFEEGVETETVSQLKSSPPGEAPVSRREVEDTIIQIRNCVINVARLQQKISHELQSLREKQT